MRKVISVKAFDYYLICTLDDGNSYKYNMNFVLLRSGEMILPLRDISFFKKVYIESGALGWPNGYEIHGDTVERDGEKISSEIAS
jgi:hypothetical protein